MIEIELFISLISLLGMAGVSRHETRFIGFAVSLLGNICWIVIGLMTWNVAFLFLFGGYFIFNLIGMHDEYATWREMRRMKRKYESINHYK